MAGHYIHNGKIFFDDSKVLSTDNRSYRYGDGLFETIRVRKGIMPLWDLHMNRLFSSFEKLRFSIPVHLHPDTLRNEVEKLLKKNDLIDARVRISFYRGDGGLTDPIPPQCGYIIQTWPIQPDTLGFNNNGLHIGLYPNAQKSTDFLSNLKSANYLIYVMASLFAKEKKWNDALVLNHYHRIVDSCIANIFWVKNGNIYTTPLSEGPVDGVMRKFIVQNQNITEKPITPEELLESDEVFLTNAVKGIQWVGLLGDKRLSPPLVSSTLYNDCIKPLFG